MTDQHGESEAGPLQDDFDSVPEHLEADAAAGSLLAAHPVRTHLDLPRDGSVAVSLYMTHTTERLYGTAKAIQAIRQVGLAWATAHPGHAIGIGDISKRDGGQISGHASHRKGIDLDVRPLRTDGQRRRVTIHDAEYSRELTGKLIQAFVNNGIVPVTHVFFNDAALKNHPVQPWPNHDNHFHVRFKEG